MATVEKTDPIYYDIRTGSGRCFSNWMSVLPWRKIDAPHHNTM